MRPAKVVPMESLWDAQEKYDIESIPVVEDVKPEEPLVDRMGNLILLDDHGRPINAVFNGNAPSRMQQQINYVMENLDYRIESLHTDEGFQKHKVVYYLLTFTSCLVGAVLFCYGMHLTIFFDGVAGKVNYVAIAFGVVFWSPFLMLMKYICYPHREERKKRRKLAWDRRDRRKATLFNQLVDEAKAATEPPAYKTRVIAHFRKREYPLVCATWKDFCEMFYDKTGLPPERLLIRFQEKDLDIDLASAMHVAPYSLPQNAHLWIYNRGGYFTQDTKVKRQYEDLVDAGNRKVPPKYEQPPDFDRVEPFNLRKTIVEFMAFTPRTRTGNSPRTPRAQSREGNTAAGLSPRSLSISQQKLAEGNERRRKSITSATQVTVTRSSIRSEELNAQGKSPVKTKAATNGERKLANKSSTSSPPVPRLAIKNGQSLPSSAVSLGGSTAVTKGSKSSNGSKTTTATGYAVAGAKDEGSLISALS